MNSHMNTATSSLTDRYQTTIPSKVREALQLDKQDKIAYELLPDGSVTLRKADTTDPVLDSFLAFLADDMSKNPERISAMNPNLAKHVLSLTDGLDVDLDAPLLDEDD